MSTNVYRLNRERNLPGGPGPRKESRGARRFRIDRAGAVLYVRGFLADHFGLGRTNVALAAIDFSESGVLMLLRDPLSNGAPVHVRITTPDSAETFEADGEVRWCFRSTPTAQVYRAGICFKSLPRAQAKKIARIRECFASGASSDAWKEARPGTDSPGFKLLP